ncbi:hypothetical protein [Actinomadura rubrisoli]|uniref:Uncharacterized protein n=1 Tax=Actinomadura rubrisoli TaxID=2530368 RepID=A0A4R4ZPN6_9ACTN|nr:hypothetical protein [Actinomadura rubrisoli]TDD60116.1 hypothetical protein E1298_46255 [Actinomadura rubrisoli]
MNDDLQERDVRTARRTAHDQDLRQELRRLCKGRGVLTPDLTVRLGPLLRERMCGPSPTGRRDVARRRDVRADLTAALASGLGALPQDLAVVARVALGMHDQARHRFLGDRLSWLAGESECDVRTVRRRLDESLDLLSEVIGQDSPGRPAVGAGAGVAPGSWYCASVRTLVLLDRPAPEVHEERRIVATQASVDEITIAVSLPPSRERGRAPRRELMAEVMRGGLLLRAERPSESHFRFVIGLPGRLGVGGHCDLALRFRIPADQRMASHYALVPFGRCDEFRLCVRFPLESPPPAVRLLSAIPPRMIDDGPAGLPRVGLDRVGEAEARFTDLVPGLGYGFRW